MDYYGAEPVTSQCREKVTHVLAFDGKHREDDDWERVKYIWSTTDH
jgi:hypothetical protein